MCLKYEQHNHECITCECDDNCDCYNCYLDRKKEIEK